MKNNYEKIIKRDDGSRVKIIIKIQSVGNIISYPVDVKICASEKHEWIDTYDNYSSSYIKCPFSKLHNYIYKSQLKFVTKKELFEAKMELWMKLKPKVH